MQTSQEAKPHKQTASLKTSSGTISAIKRPSHQHRRTQSKAFDKQFLDNLQTSGAKY